MAPLHGWRRRAPLLEVDLAARGISTVLWATGFSHDFRWLEMPVLDERGDPVQRRGVTASPGLYFLGLRRMYTVKSSFLFGVGEDAAYLAEQIAANTSCPVSSRGHRHAGAIDAGDANLGAPFGAGASSTFTLRRMAGRKTTSETNSRNPFQNRLRAPEALTIGSRFLILANGANVHSSRNDPSKIYETGSDNFLMPRCGTTGS